MYVNKKIELITRGSLISIKLKSALTEKKGWWRGGGVFFICPLRAFTWSGKGACKYIVPLLFLSHSPPPPSSPRPLSPFTYAPAWEFVENSRLYEFRSVFFRHDEQRRAVVFFFRSTFSHSARKTIFARVSFFFSLFSFFFWYTTWVLALFVL